MSMMWTPAQLLLLLCVAIVIAFFIASELIESKRVRRPVCILTESEHAALVMRHLPRALRNSPQGVPIVRPQPPLPCRGPDSHRRSYQSANSASSPNIVGD